MVRSENIHDYYDADQYLRVWSIDDSGQARCEVNAIPVAEQSQADIDAQIAANAAVRTSIEAVEAYEAALKLSAQEEPPATVTEYDVEGNPSEVTNPDYTAWVAAGETVANVSADVLTLAQKRAGTWVDPEAEDQTP